MDKEVLILQRHNLLILEGDTPPGIVKRQDKYQEGKIEVGYSYPEKIDGVRVRKIDSIKIEDIKKIITPYGVIEEFYEKNRYIVLDELVNIGKELNIEIGLFGSLALELVTGKKYFTKDSDIDIVIKQHEKERLELLYQRVEDIENRHNQLIDVEIELASGYGIKLKECFNNTKTVLAKGLSDVTLIKNIF